MKNVAKSTKFRKILSLILAVALVFTGMNVAVNSKVKAEGNPTIYGKNVATKAGEEITVPVLVKNLKALVSFSMKVSYDSSVLTMKDVNKGALIAGNKNDPSFGISESGDGYFELQWAGVENLTEDGELYIITFTVSDKAKAGNSKISFAAGSKKADTSALDGDGFNDVTLDFSEIGVTVKEESTEPEPTDKPLPTGDITTPAPSTDVKKMPAFNASLNYSTTISWLDGTDSKQTIGKSGEYRFSFTIPEDVSKEASDKGSLNLYIDTDAAGTVYGNLLSMELLGIKVNGSEVNASGFYYSGYELGDASKNYQLNLSNPWNENMQVFGDTYSFKKNDKMEVIVKVTLGEVANLEAENGYAKIDPSHKPSSNTPIPTEKEPSSKPNTTTAPDATSAEPAGASTAPAGASTAPNAASAAPANASGVPAGGGVTATPKTTVSPKRTMETLPKGNIKSLKNKASRKVVVKIKTNWKADKYKIRYKAKGFSWRYKTIYGSKTTIKGLVKGKKYIFQTRMCGDYISYRDGAWSAKKSIKIKK